MIFQLTIIIGPMSDSRDPGVHDNLWNPVLYMLTFFLKKSLIHTKFIHHCLIKIPLQLQVCKNELLNLKGQLISRCSIGVFKSS